MHRMKLVALAALLACAPKDPKHLGYRLVVHGVVTDAATRVVVDGVKVTLLGSDRPHSVSTDAGGYFRFDGVEQRDGLLVQFQKDGWTAATLALSSLGASADAGVVLDLDGIDASIALVRALALAVSGWVHAGPDLAKAAEVLLMDVSGAAPIVAYRATAGDDGRFVFAAVRPSLYELWVLPFDRDGDGVSEYQLTILALGSITSGAANLSNLTVVLKDVSHDLQASSFVNLSVAYPVTPAQLVAGVTGLLQTPGPITLHFGAEVDQALTQFELVPIESGGRVGAPIGLTVAWDKGVFATLTPAVALLPFPTGAAGYQLRIRALRFRDGFVAIAPSGTAFGAIGFTVGALPAPLANPTPGFYLGGIAGAASVAVDANAVWILDANGDFVVDPPWTSSNAPLLQWQHVPGALKYHVFVRNTTSAGGGASLQWKEAATVTAPEPNLNPTVVASVNLFSATLGLGYSGMPWLFGNGVLVAVTSEDANGFQAAIDPAKALSTKDVFGGLVSAIAQDGSLTGAFAATVERGSSFVKSFRIDFSEPMSTASALTLTAATQNVSVSKVNALAWGTTTGPSATPSNTGTSAFINLALAARGACTELMLDRVTGDLLLPVRDAALFAAATDARVLLLNSTTGAFLAESLGIAKVDPGLLTLSVALTANAAKGSLACALQAPAQLAHATTISNTSASIAVDNPALFMVGETVLLYLPQTGGAGQIAETRSIAGIDTTSSTLVLNANPSAGHSTSTLVLPLNVLGGEYALRQSATLSLARDTAGGAGIDLPLASAPAVMVGDVVLVDADGDLRTTVDQVQATVKALKLTTAPFAITLDLPAAMLLLRGRARVTALGDAFAVGGAKDTGAAPPDRVLNAHKDQFTADGTIF